MDQQGFPPSSGARTSGSDQTSKEELSPGEKAAIDKYTKRLKKLTRLSAQLEHRECLVLAEAREELKKPYAWTRLLENLDMSEDEANKRLAIARSKRIASEEFQKRILPNVVGYSNLAAIESLKDEAYEKLLNELPTGCRVTKSVLDNVAQGNSPGDKLTSVITVKLSEGAFSELTPKQQALHRRIVRDIQEAAKAPGSIFKVTVRSPQCLVDPSKSTQTKQNKGK
jgi:hypothetical protein